MENIWNLIGKKFDSGLTPAEEQMLFEWLNSSATNKQVYAQLKELWYHKQDQTNSSQAIAAYDKLINRIKFSEVTHSRVQNTSFRIKEFARYAAIFIFLVSFGYLLYYFVNTKFVDIQYCTISVPKGNKSEVVLPDGSKIWLNNNSKLIYPKKFDTDQRKVELIGEAYFEIQHNASVPFIVQTSDVSIKVLGTKFNVSAYPNDKLIETTLVSGKVVVQSNENPKLVKTILPGEKLAFDKVNNQMSESQVDTKFYTYWMKGQFVFKDEKFEELAKKIERIYNVEIIFADPSLKEKTYTGDFRIDDNIYTVLEILKQSTTVPIEFTTERNLITVRRK